MHYLMLIQIDEAHLGPRETPDLMQAQADWTRDLVKRGVFVAADRLRPPETARTVRREGGRTLCIDGPFVETKEHLGGYYAVDVASEAEALALARGMPVAAHCPVFVAPVAKAALLPRDGERPPAQTAMLFFGPPPRVAPVHRDLRSWIRLADGAPTPVDPGARPPVAPTALALMDGGPDAAQAVAVIAAPEGGAVELRPLVLF